MFLQGIHCYGIADTTGNSGRGMEDKSNNAHDQDEN